MELSYEIPAELSGFVTPEKIGATLEAALEAGQPYYWRAKADREGNHVFYANAKKPNRSVLLTTRVNRAKVESGEAAAAQRRWRAGHLEISRG